MLRREDRTAKAFVDIAIGRYRDDKPVRDRLGLFKMPHMTAMKQVETPVAERDAFALAAPRTNRAREISKPIRLFVQNASSTARSALPAGKGALRISGFLQTRR